jgi:hypothetical protein
LRLIVIGFVPHCERLKATQAKASQEQGSRRVLDENKLGEVFFSESSSATFPE